MSAGLSGHCALPALDPRRDSCRYVTYCIISGAMNVSTHGRGDELRPALAHYGWNTGKQTAARLPPDNVLRGVDIGQGHRVAGLCVVPQMPIGVLVDDLFHIRLVYELRGVIAWVTVIGWVLLAHLH